MQRFEPFAVVMGAARRLAVDGDHVVSARPQACDPTLKTARKQRWIDPVHQVAQPARARNAMIELRELPQEIEMMLAPFDDVFEIVA